MIKYLLISKTVTIECVDPNEIENENFRNGIINLNPLLRRNVEHRLPRYTIGRFANVRDVQRVSPRSSNEVIKNILKIFYDSGCLNIKQQKQIVEEARNRVHQSIEKPIPSKQFDLSACSPWLSKEKPLSARPILNNPMKQTIYTSISALHSVENDFIQVEDTDMSFGYIYSGILIKATVAFPPVCEDEIWTVGWINALEFDKKYYHYDTHMT